MSDSVDRERERFEQSMAILAMLRRVPLDERAARLEDACAGDVELQAQVEALLAAEETRDDLLGACGPGQLFRDEEEGERESRTSYGPAQVGPYRLLQLLGEGGMGSVYEAEQERPHRRVAVKLLQSWLGSDAAGRRFEREAEFLGQLSHPGIAGVIESGLHRD
ncbi:MAG: hypothetical protein AAF533_30475 [Acidobacteriota bacterium]